MTGRCARNWWMPTRWMLMTFAAPMLNFSGKAPPARGRGGAGGVVGEVFVEVVAGGAAGPSLRLRPSTPPAISLYQAAGFCLTGRRQNYYTAPVEDALLMTCGLERKTQFPLG